MKQDKIYAGLNNDTYGGLTPTGNIIRDAWLFDILPQDQTCDGWALGRIQEVYDKVYAAWEPYGHMVSLLPDELKSRHSEIYDTAVKRARELGWDPDLLDE
ncbi:MAG: hypothetical protein GXP08_13515 [Gammaproteobacteria bacterium]|nr:hypothetical protein [Gammaproteobacteria bacterium]